MARKYSIEELRELGLVGEKTDLIPPHSDGGLLTYPGVRPDMYSTIPRVGNFAANLPIQPSNPENEIYEVLTGQTADTGSNPANTCGDPAIAGVLKTAAVKVRFGQYYKGTPIYDASKAGLRAGRWDTDRQMINMQLPAGNPFVPSPVTIDTGSINTPVGKMLLELGQSVLLDFAYTHFAGDNSKAYTAARTGFIKEYDGLDKWIRDDYADFVSTADADALNSYVISGGVTLDGDFVAQLSDVFRTLRTDAELIGMPNVTWAITINPRMLYPLIDIWACNYQTARCLVDGVSRQDVSTVTTLREQMYGGRFLLIDGERVPILTDFGLGATGGGGAAGTDVADANGTWTSDLLVVPMYNAGRPLTYLQYLPYTNAELAEVQAMGFDQVRVINGGFYLMTYKKTGFCLSYQVTARPRLIMDTPFLAARIDDISFEATTPFRTPIIGTGFKDGGTTFRENIVTP